MCFLLVLFNKIFNLTSCIDSLYFTDLTDGTTRGGVIVKVVVHVEEGVGELYLMLVFYRSR